MHKHIHHCPLQIDLQQDPSTPLHRRTEQQASGSTMQAQVFPPFRFVPGPPPPGPEIVFDQSVIDYMNGFYTARAQFQDGQLLNHMYGPSPTWDIARLTQAINETLRNTIVHNTRSQNLKILARCNAVTAKRYSFGASTPAFQKFAAQKHILVNETFVLGAQVDGKYVEVYLARSIPIPTS